MEGLTSVFGMGTGVTPPVLPPEIYRVRTIMIYHFISKMQGVISQNANFILVGAIHNIYCINREGCLLEKERNGGGKRDRTDDLLVQTRRSPS